MEAGPRAFDTAEPVNNFSVHEAGNEGSEMAPVLFYERNGDRLKVVFDLAGNTFEIVPIVFKDESSDADMNRVYREVAGLA